MENLHLARAIWKKFKPMIESPKRLMEAKRGRPKASERMAFLGICYGLERMLMESSSVKVWKREHSSSVLQKVG